MRNLNPIEFKENILRVANGDKNALKCIYEDFSYAVYALALSILHNKHDAEDVSQDVFIKIWKNARNFSPDKNPRAWIIEITKNQSIDYLRKNKHSVATDILNDLNENSSHNSETPHEQALSKINTEQLLSALPDINREIFIMHVMGELTYREISNILRIPLGKVVWNYKSSIKILKNHWREIL